MNRLLAAAAVTALLGFTAEEARAQAFAEWVCLETMSGQPSFTPWMDSLDTFPTSPTILNGFTSDSGLDDGMGGDIKLTFTDPLGGPPSDENQLLINSIGGSAASMAVSDFGVVAFPPLWPAPIRNAAIRVELSHPSPAVATFIAHSSWTPAEVRFYDSFGLAATIPITTHGAQFYGYDTATGSFVDSNFVPGAAMPLTFTDPTVFDTSGTTGATCVADRADWIVRVEIHATGPDSEVGFNDICFPAQYGFAWAADPTCAP